MSQNNKKIIKIGIYAILITAIIEVILVEGCNLFKYNIASILLLASIVVLMLIHFYYGFKKTSDFIVDNRYKISFILIPIITILGFFENNLGIKEWLLAIDIPLCLWCNIKFFALLLITYDFFNMILKDKDISKLGTILIAFSGFILWDFAYADSLIVGEFIILTLYRIINLDGMKQIVNAVLLGISIILYTFTFQAFAVPFGYVFLALGIWVLIDNKEKIKQNAKKITILFIVTIILTLILSSVLHNVINYNELSYNKNNNNSPLSYIFSYVFNLMMPYMKDPITANMGSFISLFPIPLLLAMYYLYKNEDHVSYLMPLIVVSILEFIIMMVGLPAPLEKITLFKNENSVFCMPAISLASLLILVYMIKNIDKEFFKFNITIRITILSLIFIAFVPMPVEYLNNGCFYFVIAIISLLEILFLNINDKKYKKVLIEFLIILALISSFNVKYLMKDRQMEPKHLIYEQNIN